MQKRADTGYNERLFDGGFRGYLHNARFRWFKKRLKSNSINTERVIELGCFDGKLIEHFETMPQKYLGLDANWEGGLDIARDKWVSSKGKNVVFKDCVTPDDIDVVDSEYDIAVCMETLEHVPPELVEPYLEVMAKATDGYVFITVPNEIGIVFLAKYLFKSLFGDTQKYELKEILFATMGMTDRVNRHDHKGFDYRVLVNQVSKYFDIVEVSGHPLTIAPTMLNFGIGIIGRSKTETVGENAASPLLECV